MFKLNFKNFEIFFIMGILIIFLFCSLPQLSLPGLGRFESLAPALALKLLIKNDFSLSKLINFPFFGLLNALNVPPPLVLIYIFVFYLFGASILTVRLTGVFFGLVFLLLFYLFIRSFFSKRIAMFSLALIATLPYFIFYTRVHIDLYFVLIFIFGYLLFFLRFYKKRRLLDLCISSLFLGMGASYHNPLFWWFIFAFVIIAFILYKGFCFKKKELITGFLFFLLGASPIILWSLNTPFESNITNYITQRSIYFPILNFGSIKLNHNPALMLERESLKYRFDVRFSQFHNFLDSNINWSLFIISFVFLMISTFGMKLPLINGDQKNISFFLIFIIIFFFETIFLSWNSSPYHMFNLIPFCLVLSAKLLDYICKYSKILAYSILLLVIVLNISVFAKNFNDFTSGLYINPTFGFRGLNVPLDFPSENIYLLAEYLQEHKIYKPVIVSKDKSEIRTLTFLTSFKVRPVNLTAEERCNESKFVDRLREELNSVSQDKMFIIPIIIPNVERYDALNITTDILKELNKIMIVNKTFYLKNGEIEYLLFNIKDL